MSRSRNIKPGFFKNEILVELPFEVRLLFIGLWTLADREGRLEDRPVRIKMEVFPADSVDVNAALDALHRDGFIQRYAVGEGKYIQILAWKKHQNPHCKESASTIPAPCLHGSSTETSGTSRADSLIPDSLIPDSPADADLLGASKGDSKGRNNTAVEIDTWLRSLDGDAIPADDPIFDYATKTRIPLDFLELSWHRFVEDMRERGKRQKDWRAHYRNAVRGNWLKLWWFAPDGDCRLTTTGEQAKRALA